MVDLHQHIAAARDRLARVARAHPDAYVASVIAAASLAAILFAGSVWLAYDIVHDLPNAAQLRDIGAMAQATTLYDKNNHPASTIFQEQRIEMPLSDISPNLVRAIISIEDQRFYDHSGVDVLRVMAAAVTNFRARRAAPRRVAARSPSSWRARVFSPRTRRCAASSKRQCWPGASSASSRRARFWGSI